MIRFGKEVCSHLDLASRREWLETNGIGGFASSTIIGLNTRRYHGLLVAALTPPVGRYVLLSKLEETLTVGARSYELGTNRYPGVVHPQGYQYLAEFRLDPFPTFVYRIRNVRAEDLKGIADDEKQELELEKTIFLVYGENTVVIEYKLRSPIAFPANLQLCPLSPFATTTASLMKTQHSTAFAISSHILLPSGLIPICPRCTSPTTRSRLHHQANGFATSSTNANRSAVSTSAKTSSILAFSPSTSRTSHSNCFSATGRHRERA